MVHRRRYRPPVRPPRRLARPWTRDRAQRQFGLPSAPLLAVSGSYTCQRTFDGEDKGPLREERERGESKERTAHRLSARGHESIVSVVSSSSSGSSSLSRSWYVLDAADRDSRNNVTVTEECVRAYARETGALDS